MKFQFPPPRGGEPSDLVHSHGDVDFNSRPREGANDPAVLRQRLGAISIPAPARGRTACRRCRRSARPISIPAPARGRTSARLSPCALTDFNSRPREGANAQTHRAGLFILFQFPPPRGGEPKPANTDPPPEYFNSRPREGANPGQAVPLYQGGLISIPAPARGRTFAPVNVNQDAVFQFPPPRGGEPRQPFPRTTCGLYFNSRPREGANVHICAVCQLHFISIPAPARGRTTETPDEKRNLDISIPAPARGRTVAVLGDKPIVVYFNSRPREEANGCTESGRAGVCISIPAPARGRTENPPQSNTKYIISIPAPARGRTLSIVADIAGKVIFQFPPPRGGERKPSYPAGPKF